MGEGDTPRSSNEEREQRILDAARSLLLYFGYDKTTVSDIAREAGISKGAIYLHFDSKDALFEALLIRELAVYSQRWLERIEADPDGGTIGGLYKNTLYAINASAFMSAIFKQDKRILGSYVRKPDSIFRDVRYSSNRYVFVKMMQDAGAMRDDIDADIVAHIMNMLAYGLVAMDDVMDDSQIPPTDDLIEGIATMMDRAFTPDDADSNEAGKQVVRQIVTMARQALENQNNSDE